MTRSAGCVAIWATLAMASGSVARAAPQAAGPVDAVNLLAARDELTTRYRDVEAAVIDGYRPVGPDAPAMGTHWVHGGLLVEGVLDPARPPILTYIKVDGRDVLAGVAYAALLAPGERPPRAPAGGAWHDHAGTIDEEILGGSHDLKADVSRLAVLHAWNGIENPDGEFVAENWALPWARLGLSPPADPPTDAARALALATPEGAAWYAALVRAAGLSDTECRRAEEALDRLAVAVRSALTTDPQRLARMWVDTWEDVAAALSADAAAKVAQVRVR